MFTKDHFGRASCLQIKGGSSSTSSSIQANSGAFAALHADGAVVCWGDAACGGDLPPGAVRQPVAAPVRRHGLRGTLSRRRCLRLGPRPPLAATWAVHSQSYTTSPLSKPTPAPSPPCAWRRYLLGRFCLRRSIPALPGPPGLCRCGNPGRSQGLCYCFSNGRVAAGQSSGGQGLDTELTHIPQPQS